MGLRCIVQIFLHFLKFYTETLARNKMREVNAKNPGFHQGFSDVYVEQINVQIMQLTVFSSPKPL